jgi:hypothetical protein
MPAQFGEGVHVDACVQSRRPGIESRLDDPALFLNPHTLRTSRAIRKNLRFPRHHIRVAKRIFPVGALCYGDSRRL